MAKVPERRATLADLHHVEGQAELIGGRIRRHPFHGFKPGRIIFEIACGLDEHAGSTGRGEVFTSTLAYAVPELPSGRESFSPDVSYYEGPLPANPMAFIQGPPTFAVEVRSENDHGPAAEAEMAARRLDYFEAGTLVVWDVDPEAELIRSYRSDDPGRPTTFGRGQVADAEPAVPGWRLAVDAIF